MWARVFLLILFVVVVLPLTFMVGYHLGWATVFP